MIGINEQQTAKIAGQYNTVWRLVEKIYLRALCGGRTHASFRKLELESSALTTRPKVHVT